MKNKLLKTILFTAIFFFSSKGQTWQWADNSGSTTSNMNRATSVCSDKDGNIIIAGFFDSPTISFGSYTLSNFPNNYQMFITKYDPIGNVIWVKTGSGSNYFQAYSVSCDTAGNIFLAGDFMSPSVAFGSFTLTNSTSDIHPFIAKFDSNGNALWLKDGVGNLDGALSITNDRIGNTYLIGSFDSPTIIFGSYTLTNNGFQDMFLIKYDANGSVIWARSAGNITYDYGRCVSTDSLGNIYIVGNFYSPTIAIGTHTLTNTGLGDLYIAKYNQNGTAIWAKNANCPKNDLAYSISTDSKGNSYITGVFTHSVMTFGTYTLTNNSVQNNVFLAKYDSSGTVVWAKAATSFTSSNHRCYSISTDNDNVYIAGGYTGKIGFDTYTLTAPVTPSLDPMFVVKYTKNGSATFATSLPTGGSAIGPFVKSVDSCNIYVTGGYNANYPFVVGSNTLAADGGVVVFTAKLDCAAITTRSHQLESQKGLANLFPNPTSGLITISANIGSRVSIMNALGEFIYQDHIHSIKQNIDLSEFTRGLYFINIVGNNQSLAFKVLKE